jgi:periplasmic protein TonB
VIDETAGADRGSTDSSRTGVVKAKAQRAGVTNGLHRAHHAPAAPYRSDPRASGASVAARVFGVVGLSLGTHMAMLGLLGFMPSPQAYFGARAVEMEVIEPEPPPPPPPEVKEEPPKPPEPEPARPKPVPKPAAAKPEPEPPPEQVKPAPEAPVDLTGVTLTGEDGASWSSIVGSGEALKGPAPRVAAVTGKDRGGSNQGAVGGQGDKPLLVSEASLSRKPVPPDGMDALLERNFPPRARAQGVSGSALLRVRIQADGSVSDMQTLRETGDHGFGAACMKTLRVRRWQPPLDRTGRPVATEIRYSCEFEVAY